MRMKKWMVILLAVSMLLTGCASSESAQQAETAAQVKTRLTEDDGQQEGEIAKLEEELRKLKEDHQSLKSRHQGLQDDRQLKDEELEAARLRIADFSELEKKYQALSEAEIEAAIAETELNAEKDRKAKEEILADEEEEAERIAEEEAEREAEKEKKGYETGITFNDIARKPDEFMLDKVKFVGTVLQVIEGEGEINLRIAIGDDYDKVILVYYPSDLLNTRVLEDDEITIYGTSMGLYTYEATLGGKITIPLVEVDRIDL